MNNAPGRASAISSSLTWYAANSAPPDLGFLFLTHRGPGVGVNGMRADHRVRRVVEQAHPRAVPSVARRLLHDGSRQLIRFGTRDVDVDAEHGGGMHERGRDVVAVADVGDRAAAQLAEPFLQREEVGNRLTRVFFVGERVDDVQLRALPRRTASAVPARTYG